MKKLFKLNISKLTFAFFSQEEEQLKQQPISETGEQLRAFNVQVLGFDEYLCPRRISKAGVYGKADVIIVWNSYFSASNTELHKHLRHFNPDGKPPLRPISVYQYLMHKSHFILSKPLATKLIKFISMQMPIFHVTAGLRAPDSSTPLFFSDEPWIGRDSYDLKKYVLAFTKAPKAKKERSTDIHYFYFNMNADRNGYDLVRTVTQCADGVSIFQFLSEIKMIEKERDRLDMRYMEEVEKSLVKKQLSQDALDYTDPVKQCQLCGYGFEKQVDHLKSDNHKRSLSEMSDVYTEIDKIISRLDLKQRFKQKYKDLLDSDAYQFK